MPVDQRNRYSGDQKGKSRGTSCGSIGGVDSGSNHHSSIQSSSSSSKVGSVPSLSLPITIGLLGKVNSISGLGESNGCVVSWEPVHQAAQMALVDTAVVWPRKTH